MPASDSAPRVAMIIGSTRPSRICPVIARWCQQAIQEDSPLRYELIDLAEVALPFLDEPLKAALERYEHEHTLAWSRLISSYDGFFFVFPQYNWGYPGVLKNALDFLYAEWGGKPASLATYGTRGGNRGARQLGEVLQGLHMNILEEHLGIVITEDDIDDEWQLLDLETVMAPYVDQTQRIDAQMVEAIKNRPSVQ
jgi:NAD(P)H-dependent FMN reductase